MLLYKKGLGADCMYWSSLLMDRLMGLFVLKARGGAAHSEWRSYLSPFSLSIFRRKLDLADFQETFSGISLPHFFSFKYFFNQPFLTFLLLSIMIMA